MPHQAPRWEVEAHVVLRARSGGLRNGVVQIRMYPDGHGFMTVNGVCYPIRKGMSVADHYDRMFGDAYGLLALEAWASGD